MTRGPLIGPGSPSSFDGEAFQQRFDTLADEGRQVHGEADFVMGFLPESVLDAGCGTGRVALELARRGVFVIGVDRDPSMLAVARRKAEEGSESGTLPARFVEADLVGLDLEASFDVVVMAGNVPLFADPGTQHQLVESVARHVARGGVLVAGFQLDRSYSTEDYDLHCSAAGLRLASRYATWEGDDYHEAAGYAVSVHERT